MNNYIDDKNYIFFKDNFDNIVKNHIGKFVLIHDCNVSGYYSSFNEAHNASQKMNFPTGTFIIQECLERIDMLYATYYTSYVLNIIGANNDPTCVH